MEYLTAKAIFFYTVFMVFIIVITRLTFHLCSYSFYMGLTSLKNSHLTMNPLSGYTGVSLLEMFLELSYVPEDKYYISSYLKGVRNVLKKCDRVIIYLRLGDYPEEWLRRVFLPLQAHKERILVLNCQEGLKSRINAILNEV